MKMVIITSKKANIHVSVFLVVTLLGLMFMLIMLKFIDTTSDAYKDKAYNEECHDYIRYSMISNKLDMDFDLTDSPCKRKPVTIKTNSEYEATGDVLDLMTQCYNAFYRGNNELFFAKGGDEVRFCSMCYKVNFTNKDIDIDAWEFFDYMKLKHHSGERYMEILASKDLSRDYLNDKEAYEQKHKEEFEKQKIINGNNEYLVVFMYDKKEEPQFWKRQINKVIDLFAGPLSGFMKLNNEEAYRTGVFLVELKSIKIKDLDCTKVMGVQQPGITRNIDSST